MTAKAVETIEVDGRTITIESGNWAKQAHGSVVYRCGNLVLLATVCAEKEARDSQDFFPLTVDYREKIYSVGRFPGGYIKRENRPAEHETLLSRLIDRPIRPLFPTGYFSEVQLLVTVLSADANTTVEGHAMTAASAALMASDIPFDGPIAGVVVGLINGELVADPDAVALKESELELVVAGSEEAIAMIEGGAREVPAEKILEALEFAHAAIKERIAFQKKLAATLGVTKRDVKLRLPNPEIVTAVRAFAFDRLTQANRNSDKAARSSDIDIVCSETVGHFEKLWSEQGVADLGDRIRTTKKLLHDIEAEVVRNYIFDDHKRSDGRDLNEVRDISIELDVLPCVHGSSIFTRGQTQSLGVVTLGTAGDNQRFENLAGHQHKNFMLHYNFPPFSTGEVKRMPGPGRREIGHGNLAERALKPLVPSQESFPYVVRVVSEILESNGSSSMASVCSGSMAMMAAGVPVERGVSGIAMGLILNEKGEYVILSDIAGLEDHFGDMDFKVAGTERGITAFQLDIKVKGLSIEILRNALAQADEGRLHILSKMNEAISKSRDSVPTHAPRISTIQIDVDRIGELIGPGGKVIRSIMERSGADVNVEDSGVVTISSPSGESNEAARRIIEDLFREINEGETFEGVVKRIVDFGAFIEVLPGKEGLLHISKMSSERVASVRDLYNEGDRVEVVVAGVDRQGRIDLIQKDLYAAGGNRIGGRPAGDRGDRGGDRPHGGDRDRDRGGRGGGSRGGPRR